MKVYSIIFSIIVFVLVACNDDGQKVEAIESKDQKNTKLNVGASDFELAIPQTSNAELKQFYISYKSSLNGLLLAVRKNDALAIKEAYKKYDVDFDNIGNMTDRAMALSGKEEEIFFQYINQTQPFMSEIHASPTVMELDSRK